MSDHRICDYEDATYRTDFWEGKGRDYEDRVERIAIQRLMPLSGQRLLQAGAGFGRLTPMFDGYEQIVLLDYSRSQLEYARQQYGDEGILYVAADLYNMPFAPALFDGVTLIRVIHHMENAPAVLRSLREVMVQGGTFILEFANKQNLKAILRWFIRRQDWNPFTLEPVEFVELNYDFHPTYIRQALNDVGFRPGRILTVSHLRIGIVKRLVPAGILVALDSLFQLTGPFWQLSPSVFVRNEAIGSDDIAPEGAFWRCPSCGSYDLPQHDDRLICDDCSTQWGIVNGVYDFKTPLNT